MRYTGYGYDSSTVIILLLLSLAAIALLLAAQWRLFRKAGEPGWKAIIPIYGGYVFSTLVWTPGAFYAMVGLSLASLFTGRVPVLNLTIALAIVVLGIVYAVKTTRAYGKGGGFALGMVLLPLIFLPILAFGDSRYVGPSGEVSVDRADDAPQGNVTLARADADNGPVRTALILVGVIALAAVGFRLWLSVVHYRPLRPGPFVGLQNYARALSVPTTVPAFASTLLARALDLALAVGLGFLGAAAGRRRGRAAVAGLGLMLAAIPAAAWESLPAVLDSSLIMSAPLFYLGHALPWAGLSMFAGALLAPMWPRYASAPALVAPALMLLSGVSSVSMPVINPVRTLDTQIFQMGLAKFEVSAAAALEVLRGAVTLPLAAVGLLLLANLLRGSGRDNTVASHASPAPAALLAGLIPLGLGALILTRGNREALSLVYGGAVGYTAIEFTATLAVGFGLYLGLFALLGRFDPDAPAPLGLTMILALSLGALSMGGYLLARKLGLMYTVVPVIAAALLDPMSLTFAFVLVLLRPGRGGSRPLLAASAAAFAAGRCATNQVSSTLFLKGMLDLASLARASIGRYYQFGFCAGLLLVIIAVPAALAALFALGGSNAMSEGDRSPLHRVPRLNPADWDAAP